MVMKSPVLIPKDENSIPSQKFVLYLKVKEITAVNDALEVALKMPVDQQKKWAEEYGVILDEALNTFIDDTNIILEKISLDDELLELSEKLVVGLRSAVQHIDTLLSTGEELES